MNKIHGFVLKAYAGVNYSLAITLDGKLYEWGM
jgi:alpha-tubulin suppressor-like RCC1 family protein